MAKMFKVLKGNVGGFGNKTYKKGDEVSEDMFPAGNAKTLAKMDFLEEIKGKSKPKPTPEPEVEIEEVEEDVELEKDSEDSDELKPIGDYNKDDIIALLKDRKIEFNPLSKKGELYELLK